MFGWSVAFDGDTVLVGADDRSGLPTMCTAGSGAAYVFTLRNAKWMGQQVLRPTTAANGATFGWLVAIAGEVAAISAPYVDWLSSKGSGEVYVFGRSGDAWSFQQLLAANHPRAEDYFGNTLALTPDVLLVGATGDASGASGANADGARSDAPAAGAVYLFEERDAG
jgi:hypothetical protein